MDSSNTNSDSPIIRLIPVLLFLAGIIGLYYLYQYLFGPTTGNSYTLLSTTQSAQVDPSKPITITSNQLPPLYEGGEFTISTWIYITTWGYRAGMNKSIISVGGPNFDTIRVYLGGNKPKLSVRLHTKEKGATPSLTSASNTASNASNTTAETESLDKSTQNMTFANLQTDSGLLEGSPICDLPEVDLQRWVNITIAVNGKTVDVYMDGKLSRSCVLPSFYKVDAGGYSANLLSYGGFGGQIANTVMYDAALHPEAVYKNYIAGPQPVTGFAQWISSFFAPGVAISVSTNAV
jgi:hypothetical protein